MCCSKRLWERERRKPVFMLPFRWRGNGENTDFMLDCPPQQHPIKWLGVCVRFCRSRRYHASEPVRLLHSMAWLSDEGQPSFCPDFDKIEINAMLGDGCSLCGVDCWELYAVGTVDQAMMSVLLVKYGVLRLLGLAEKALIIDELHSYDVYMSEILHRLLEWCKVLEIPVVLLSATLPPEKKTQTLSAYTAQSILFKLSCRDGHYRVG